MVRRLTSLLINRISWKLLFKVALFALALFWVWQSDFSWWTIAAFFLILFSIYLSETGERGFTRFSFWLGAALSVEGLYLLLPPAPEAAGFYEPIIFWAAVLFFAVLLGLNRLLFKNRFFVYGMLSTVLLFFLFLVYYSLPRTFLWTLLLFLAVTLLIKEALEFFGFRGKKRNVLVGALVGFLSVEISWVLGFLPLGFINAAIFLTLITLLLRDSLTRHFTGSLNAVYILRELTLFIVFAMVIFAVSNWTI